MPLPRAKINENVFDDCSPEAAYWAGLIAADGALLIKKTKTKDYQQIVIYLSGEDGKHLKGLINFTQSSYQLHRLDTSKRSWGKEGSYLLGCCIYSPIIWNWLHSHGITQRKSHSLEVSALLAESPDFWRGVIDGDGSVSLATRKTKKRGKEYSSMYPWIALGGSLPLMQQFQSFISGAVGKRPAISSCKSIFRVALSGPAAQDLIRILYDRQGPALPRKQQVARLCLEWNGKRTLK